MPFLTFRLRLSVASVCISLTSVRISLTFKTWADIKWILSKGMAHDSSLLPGLLRAARAWNPTQKKEKDSESYFSLEYGNYSNKKHYSTILVLSATIRDLSFCRVDGQKFKLCLPSLCHIHIVHPKSYGCIVHSSLFSGDLVPMIPQWPSYKDNINARIIFYPDKLL